MRHPLDEIYKAGLRNQEHTVNQEDWRKAKDMLDLGKRKRRFPIWWFGVAAGLLLGAAMIPRYFGNQDISTSKSITETSITRQISANKKGVLTIDSIHTSAKEQSLEVNHNHNQELIAKQQLNNPQTSSNGIDTTQENQKSLTKSEGMQVIIPKINTSITESEGVQEELTIDLSLPNEVSVSQAEERIKRRPTSLSYIVTPENAKLLDINGRGPRTQAPLANSLEILSQEIKALYIKFELPQIEYPFESLLVCTTEGVTFNPYSINLYGAYTIPNYKPSLGFAISTNISGRWFTSIGLGANYYRKNNLRYSEALDIIDARGFLQASNLTETLSFQQFSLEVPFNIDYNIRSHKIMAIALAEFNLWSELTQDALITNNDLADIEPLSPVMDMNDPIILTQQATRINTAVLSMPNYYIGMGYGVLLSNKIALQINGLWNLNSSKESIRTSLSSTQSDLLNNGNWILRTSFTYRL